MVADSLLVCISDLRLSVLGFVTSDSDMGTEQASEEEASVQTGNPI